MTTAQRLTFEDYLNYDDGTDTRYQLIDGRLIELLPESESNDAIANCLFLMLVNSGIPFRLVRPHTCEIQVPVLQAGDPANRYPDLVVIREEHLELTQKRLTITFEVLPPLLVVEVVSPGQLNRERDYERKRQQYAARGIPEYWLVDQEQQVIVVLALTHGEYSDVGTFQGETPTRSSLPELQRLQLTPAQVLSAVA